MPDRKVDNKLRERVDLPLLLKLFPFAVAFDASGHVLVLGHSMRLLGFSEDMEVGKIFTLVRPCTTHDFSELARYRDQVFAAEVVGTPLQLRGQMELVDDAFLFLAFPWASSAEAMVAMGIQLSDFPPHCATADMLMMIQGRSASFKDVERLNTELSEKSASHAALLGGIPDLIMQLDAQGRLSNVKPSPYVPLPFRVHELAGKSLTELYPDEVGVSLDEARRAAQEERVPKTLEFRGTGTQLGREYETRVSPGMSGEVFMIVRDVTARKVMERELVAAREDALAAMRVKSEFLATMSHELRTPMNGVIGLTELLMQTTLDAEQRGYLRRLRRSSEVLLELIDDVLDASKAEAGKLELSAQDFSPRELLDEAVSVLWERAETQGVELIARTASSVPQRLHGDQMRLRQILVNLIGNAVKFTHDGQVRVELSIEAQDGNESLLRCEVIDSGIGISEEAQSRLFKPFSQADSSLSRRYGGTGLGLSICKHLVDLMRGRIGVHSQIGEGSTFWFTARVQPATTLGEEVLGATRLLIVGGPAATQRMLGAFVGTWGLRYEAATFSDALAKLERAAAAGDAVRAAIIVAADGDAAREFVGALRNRPALSQVRILLVDGREGFTLPRVHGVVPRPVRQSQFLDALSDVLADKRLSLAPASLRPTSLHKMHALVVDDNETNRMVLVNLLRKFGLDADAVDSGPAAISAFRKSPYPLVFMDVQMPDMDGYETAARIRQLHTPTTIIAVTANSMPGDRERCLSRGMDLYLAKPLRTADVRDVLGVVSDQINVPVHVATPSTPHEAQNLDLELLGEMSDGDLQLESDFLRGVARDLPPLLAHTRERLEAGELRAAAESLHPASGFVRAVSSGLIREKVIELNLRLRNASTEPSDALLALASIEELATALLRDIVAHLSEDGSA